MQANKAHFGFFWHWAAVFLAFSSKWSWSGILVEPFDWLRHRLNLYLYKYNYIKALNRL